MDDTHTTRLDMRRVVCASETAIFVKLIEICTTYKLLLVDVYCRIKLLSWSEVTLDRKSISVDIAGLFEDCLQYR